MTKPSNVTALTSSEHFEAAIDTYNMIFDDTPATFWTDMLYEHPVWRATGAHRSIFDDDRPVALASLARWDQRFGATTLAVGEIGLVGTLPDYRHRGLSRRLMENWVTSTTHDDVPIMFLTGIPNFYERWNFHHACPDYVNAFLSVGHDQLTACATDPAVLRRLDPDCDLGRAVELIADEHRHIPCSPVIGPELLRFFINQSDLHGVDWLAIENYSGDICAVVRLKRWAGGIGPQHAGAVTLVAASTDDDARGMVAQALANHMADANQVQLQLAIPSHGPFGEWLFQRGARRKSSSSIFRGGYAAMYRINNLPVVLDALSTGWDDTALAKRHPGRAVTVRVGDEPLQIATIAARGERIEVICGAEGTEVGAPPAVTIPWLTGWRSANDWIHGVPYPALPGPAYNTGDPTSVDPEALAFLAELFPHRHPYIGDTIQSG